MTVMVLPAGEACDFEPTGSGFALNPPPAPVVESEPEARAETVTVVGAVLEVQNSYQQERFPRPLSPPQNILANVEKLGKIRRKRLHSRRRRLGSFKIFVL